MLTAILGWIAAAVLMFLAFLTILPQLPVGEWWVRVCDFPRLQILMLLVVPLLLLALRGWLRSWSHYDVTMLGVALGIAVFQLYFILPYTPVWKSMVEAADPSIPPDQFARIVVANLEIGNPEKPAVLKELRELKPDILLALEVDQAWHEALQALSDELTLHSHVVRDEGLGIALWSRLPVREDEIRHLVSERRASIFATIEFPGGTVRFVGIHPTPPGLKDSTGEKRRDSRVRDAELMIVADEVAEEPDENWIVTGDFNDVAWSHTTRLFQRVSGLQDPRIGRSLMNTYHADYPLFRYPIDHVFLAKGFQLKDFQRHYMPGSDHFAIVADIHLERQEGVEPEPEGDDKQDSDAMIEEGREEAAERNVEADPESTSN